jgi:hypothetical protein
MQTLITEKKLSELTGFALPTLRNARHLRRLFPYYRLGDGRRAAIRYAMEDVQSYIEQRRIDPEG